MNLKYFYVVLSLFVTGCFNQSGSIKIGPNIDYVFWLKHASVYCPDLGPLQENVDAENAGEDWLDGTPCGRIRGNVAVTVQVQNGLLGPFELVRFLGPNKQLGLQWVRREDLRRPEVYYERKLYENE